MAEVMQRSHNYDEAVKKGKIRWNGFISRKYDGVPGGYSRAKLVSRQNKPLPGVQWIHDMLLQHIPAGWVLWGEHYEVGKPFKYISGRVRKASVYEECTLLLFDLFDMFNPAKPFARRMQDLCEWEAKLPECVQRTVFRVPQYYVTEQDLWEVHDKMGKGLHGNFEGCMYKFEGGLYTLDRSWDSLKLVRRLTYDLKFLRCEEAKSSIGKPLGMAGKLFFQDAKGNVYGCGPGKLSHKERKDVYNSPGSFVNRIGTVAAKRGGEYDLLREPTFQHWHEDKIEADEV